MKHTEIARNDAIHGMQRPSVAQLEQHAVLGSVARQRRCFAEAAEQFVYIAQCLPGDAIAQQNAGAVLLEAGDIERSANYLERAVALDAGVAGFRLFAHVLALRGDIQGSRRAFESAVTIAPLDFEANWGLYEVTQLLDDAAAALVHQSIALAQRSLLSLPARTGPAQYTILELCIAGTFQANIPLDFVLDPERITVHKLFVGEHPIPELPVYDLVFNTIAEASNAGAALAAAENFIATQTEPVLNLPALVPLTSRDNVARLLAQSGTVLSPYTARMARAQITIDEARSPVLIRPVDSHAGNGLAKVSNATALAAYLEQVQAGEFYVSTFVDYRNADGYFRKYRIVFVAGVPYPVHLAISSRWMIHYYNAEMAENTWMRDEEHAFMRDIKSVFDGARWEGLAEIAQALPLDYFGIDCSIAPDGRVLLFEASTAMIVHMRDQVDLYPYKARYVPRIIRALERLFDDRLGR